MLGMVVFAAMVSLSKAERDAYYDKPPQNTLHDCGGSPEPYGECRLPAGLSAGEITAKLGAKDTVWWRNGDQFVVLARRDTDQAYLCCAARGPMDHVSGDLWAMRLRIVDLDHATIDVSVRPLPNKPMEVYRGPYAPPAPMEVDALYGRVHFQEMQSKYLDAPRNIAVYTPPGFDPKKKYPVLYCSDGNLREDTPRLLEPLILSGELPPMVIVEIWNGYSPRIENLRSNEYLLGWPQGGGYFIKHEAFLMKEVMPYVEENFGASSDPEDRIVTGFSSGAAWAISMGLRNPHVFPTVIAQSLVWKPAEHGLGGDARNVRFYLYAGTLEPMFYDETLRFADKARAEGHEVVLETSVSGHTLTIWRPMLIHALKWAFAGRKP